MPSDQRVATVDDLIKRTMIGADLFNSMRATDDDWGRYFRFTKASEQFAALLTRARSYLGLDN